MDSRVFKNTLFLYFRTAITMLVALYVSRIVLKVLGVEDYGIYNVVGGVVAMFQTLSATLSGATQRFITYALGAKDRSHLQQVFSASVKVHLLLAIMILVLAEAVGIWFINTYLNISAERMFAANIVYQCSLVCFVLDIAYIPYNSAVVAYEKMKAYAYIYIFQAFIRLGNVFLLQMGEFDKLIFYALLEVCVAIIVRLLFFVYVKRECGDCRLVKVREKSLYKQIISFSGWNFLGTSSAVVYNQGGNILLNIFWGVALNAAIGVTSQVQNAVTSLTNNFTLALNPQITKTYASGEYLQTNSYILSGSKISVYLLMLIAIPIIINADYILHLWLTDVPPYAVVFVQAALIVAVANSFFPTIHCALFATGKIRNYQIFCLIMNVSKVILLYIGFKMKFTPLIIYILPFVFTFYQMWVIIKGLRQDFQFPIKVYLQKIVMTSLLIFVCLLGLFSFLIKYISLETDFLLFIGESVGIVLVSILVVFCCGLSEYERNKITHLVRSKLYMR